MFKPLFAVLLLLSAVFSTVLSPGMLHAAPAADVALASQTQTVNINAADASTLAAELKGVGKSRAESIVSYRETYGPFFAVEDLLEVKGVGKSVIERNRDRITLE